MRRPHVRGHVLIESWDPVDVTNPPARISRSMKPAATTASERGLTLMTRRRRAGASGFRLGDPVLLLRGAVLVWAVVDGRDLEVVVLGRGRRHGPLERVRLP